MNRLPFGFCSQSSHSTGLDDYEKQTRSQLGLDLLNTELAPLKFHPRATSSESVNDISLEKAEPVPQLYGRRNPKLGTYRCIWLDYSMLIKSQKPYLLYSQNWQPLICRFVMSCTFLLIAMQFGAMRNNLTFGENLQRKVEPWEYW